MSIATAMTTLGALPIFLLTAQSVYISADLHFDVARLGLAASLFFGAAAAASFAMGSLAERAGTRVSTTFAGLLGVISSLGIALVTQSYVALLAFVLVAGTANAAMQTTSNLTLARSIPQPRQGLAFGLKQSAIPCAILIGGLAVPTLGSLLGWRSTFVLAAGASGVMGIVGLFLRGQGSGPVDRGGTHRDKPPMNALLMTTVAMTLASAAVNALGAFLPVWAFETGLHPGGVGYLLAAASATSIIGRVLSGLAADRRRGHNIPFVSGQMALGAVGILLISLGHPTTLVAGTFLAFAIGWSWPGLLMFAVVRVARDSPGVASSAVQTGAFVGGALGPFLFGVAVATKGYDTAWNAAIISLCAGAVLLLFARRLFVTDLVRRPPTQPIGSRPYER